MFCKNCGQEIDDNAYVCPHCGAMTKNSEPENNANSVKDENGKVGWGILSFFFPIVGLILFCVWRKDRPKTAKVCGITALVSFILAIILEVIMQVVAVMLA